MPWYVALCSAHIAAVIHSACGLCFSFQLSAEVVVCRSMPTPALVVCIVCDFLNSDSFLSRKSCGKQCIRTKFDRVFFCCFRWGLHGDWRPKGYKKPIVCSLQIMHKVRQLLFAVAGGLRPRLVVLHGKHNRVSSALSWACFEL